MIRKLYLTLIFIFLFLLITSSSSFAAIKNLNGQDGQDQIFSNDFNVGISSLNNIHTLFWSGLLPVSRGGTGASSFTNGSIPFISNGVFVEHTGFRWDIFNNDLILGGSGGNNLILDKGSQIKMRNDDPLGTQNIIFENSNGGGLFQISYESDFDALGIFSEIAGKGVAIDRTSGNVIIGQSISTGTFPPKGTLQIQDSTDTFDHNSTLYIGGSDFFSPPFTETTGCLVMGDSDGVGVTYITANDGVLAASATKPSICQ